MMPILSLAGLRAAALAALLSLASSAGDARPLPHWVASWGTAPATQPAAAAAGAHTFQDQTLRLIVRTSAAGSEVRIRLSNEHGTTPLLIGAAHVGLRRSGAELVPGSNRALRFGGAATAVIPPGAPLLSDPVLLDVPAQADLAISLYLPGETPATTIHSAAFQTSYVSAPGNHGAAASLPVQRTIAAWPFLTAVDVRTTRTGAAIVALGDSITDGAITTGDTNRRWPDLLMARLRGAGDLGMVNRGIGGNRLLRDPVSYGMFGRAALARFDRDVLATTGVRYLIVLIGINDIGHPGSDSAPLTETVTPAELIAGYRQLIARARAKNIVVYGATMTPFEGTVFPRYFSAEKEQVRQAVNAWIRDSGEFDAVIDFERVLRDPAHPGRLLPQFDSGDHLHPNDAGMQAMADAIPLALFRQDPPRCARGRRAGCPPR